MGSTTRKQRKKSADRTRQNMANAKKWKSCPHHLMFGNPDVIHYGVGATEPLILTRDGDKFTLWCGHCESSWTDQYIPPMHR